MVINNYETVSRILCCSRLHIHKADILMFLLTLLEILYLSYLFSFQHAADCSEYWYNICRVTINSNEI